MRWLKNSIYFTISVLALAAMLRANPAQAGAEPQPEDAIQGIVKAFDRHPIVAIAETNHGLRQAGDFYISLVKDPRFRAKVNDIVIEFGSRSSQPVVDRYINGGNVPQEELQHVWRDSTKIRSWESPIYRELLAAVRDVNRTLPAKRRLHVLAGDSPIDWQKVQVHADWDATQPNNNSFSWVILNNVLKEHRKALVILGSNHLTKGGDSWGDPDTTTLVEDKARGSMFVVMLYSGNVPLPANDQQRMASWKVPSIFPLKDTWLGSVSARGWKLEESADALLYLGPASSIVMAKSDGSDLDPEYVKETSRRQKIVYGCEFTSAKPNSPGGPCPQ